MTWNIAAINDNPFEYWITYHDAAYNEMMASVQHFIQANGSCGAACGGAAQKRIDDIFTTQMFEELMAQMQAVGWEGLDVVRQVRLSRKRYR